jgi:DNA-directed RNA polymerase specialized sigma subunit
MNIGDKQQREQNYTRFIFEMNELLQANDAEDARTQKQLLQELMKTERAFKRLMLMNEHGAMSYRKFIDFILDDKENKLSIRPYYRERQDTFSHKIFPILKEYVKKRKLSGAAATLKKLHRYRINYLFVSWILGSDTDITGTSTLRYRGPNRRKMVALCDKISSLRHTLCENNLPLACNRAADFSSKTAKKSHLQYMDLIQDASQGLLEAIDKFVPPYRKVFVSTAIGRMSLNMRDDYSATLVKLPPKDKRVLYRARKAKQKNSEISGEDLQSYVNESFKGVTSAQIALIEAAANSVVPIDTPTDSSDRHSAFADVSSVSEDVEKTEAMSKLLILLKKLKIMEKKVLLMKSGEIYGVE